MGSETPTHRLNDNPQLLFQDDAPRFSCVPPFLRHSGDPGPKTTTRQLSGFLDDRFFQPQPPDFRQRSIYSDSVPVRRDSHNWNVNGRPSADGSDDGDDDDEEEEEEEEEEELNGNGEIKHDSIPNDSSNTTSGNSSDKIGHGKPTHFSTFGSRRDLTTKESNAVASGNDNNSNNHDDVDDARGSASENNKLQGRADQFQNAVTIADPDGDLYYSQYLQGPEGSSAVGQKDILVENGCGFNGRKGVPFLSESGESLRAILSDPLTGLLMDDATILPCGHSFGGGGMQHVIRMKACYTCSLPMVEDSVAPNLSLQAAVHAFRREEELQVFRASKRRRERLEQDKSSYGDSALVDHPRGRGVQFPFSVADRVIIKGNKRTPQRFVGREAVVTTQCLNGWYVVKTLDNAESVKLQYRSLAKVPDDNPASKAASSTMAPTWL